jgi:hypothetical protein
MVSDPRLRRSRPAGGDGERVTKIAVIAAMERELFPLVEGWTRTSFQHAGKVFQCFENGEWVALAGGIGCGCAERAARAVVETCHPQTLISAGLAGALVRGLEAGSVVHPDLVVDATSGAEYRRAGSSSSGPVLVTAGEVAGPVSKEQLAKRFQAAVVDMEAAGVAKVAMAMNVGFYCVKAVSDEYHFVLPPLNSFVDSEGRFQIVRFAIWAALRPWRWSAILRLARNTSLATRALSDWLRKNLNNGPTVVTLSAGQRFKNANANRQQS